jgi:hypothetical protein
VPVVEKMRQLFIPSATNSTRILDDMDTITITGTHRIGFRTFVPQPVPQVASSYVWVDKKQTEEA